MPPPRPAPMFAERTPMNFDIHPDVAQALEQGTPVVALESTIITHGMPWPQNYDMAQQVETVIRENGAFPATVAVLNGEIKIGLSDADLRELAQTQDARKLSRADLAVCVVQR